MPLIAYQSFNSNTKTSHGLEASSFQHYTKMAASHAAAGGHDALVLPFNAQDVTTPYQGPAQRVPIARLTESQSATVFGAQVAVAWQNFFRAVGVMPAIMVCGELDTSHPDFARMLTDPNIQMTALPAKAACQSFSVVSQTALSSQITQLLSGIGFAAYEVSGIVVVFVHVPNELCDKPDLTHRFYHGIFYALTMMGKIIDLVIGDTNQKGLQYTAQSLNTTIGADLYVSASTAKQVVKFDNFGVTEKGSNATGTQMYDVAVYRRDLIELKMPPVYISQSSTGVTITDHCGLAVLVERRAGG